MPRSLLPFLASVLIFTSCAPCRVESPAAPVKLAGVLRGTTILSGTVELAGDVLIPRGSSLIIRPGTQIRVQPSESTKIDPEYLSPATELLVRGSLQIEGSPGEPVRFLPDDTGRGDDIAWAGIILDGAVESRLTGVQIARAETGILCIGSSPEIRECKLSGCRYALVLQGSSATVLDNRIEDGEGGLFCWLESHPVVDRNRITGNQEEGVFVDLTSRPVFGSNTISGNAIGVALYTRDLPVNMAGVSGNAEDLRLLGSKGEGR